MVKYSSPIASHPSRFNSFEICCFTLPNGNKVPGTVAGVVERGMLTMREAITQMVEIAADNGHSFREFCNTYGQLCLYPTARGYYPKTLRLLVIRAVICNAFIQEAAKGQRVGAA